MEILSQGTDRNLLLKFSGELDHHGAKDAIRELEEAIDAALPKKLVLDFSGIKFMDSSGIALLLRAQHRMQNLGGVVLVVQVPQQAKRVLDAAGIGRLMAIKEGGKKVETLQSKHHSEKECTNPSPSKVGENEAMFKI